MDTEKLAELGAELFLFGERVEAYGRLQAEEIDELRAKLRDLEDRLTAMAQFVEAGAVGKGPAGGDETSGALP